MFKNNYENNKGTDFSKFRYSWKIVKTGLFTCLILL